MVRRYGELPQRGSLHWAPGATVAAILLLTVVALIAPTLTDVDEFKETPTRWMFVGALFIVAVASILQLRFIVLPGQMNAAAGEPTGSIDQIEQASTTLVCAFALSDAVYGVVSSIMLDTALWAIPFGALGLASLGINLPYVRANIDRLRRERTARGEQ
jgi:hypothetical protein